MTEQQFQRLYELTDEEVETIKLICKMFNGEIVRIEKKK